MIHNHWGILVDTEQPVICVYGGNELNWEFLPELIDPNLSTADDDYSENTEWLIGDWQLCEADQMWDILNDVPHGFAMLYDGNDNIAQLVWSRTTGRGCMCSPCYPGQVNSATVIYVVELDVQLAKQEETLKQSYRRIFGDNAEVMDSTSIYSAPLQMCFVLPEEYIYKEA